MNPSLSQKYRIKPPSLKAPNITFILATILGLISGLTAAFSGALIGDTLIGHDRSSLILVQFAIITWITFCLILLKKGLGFSTGLLSASSIGIIILFVALTSSGELAGKAIISGLGLGGGIGSILGLATAISISSHKKPTLSFSIIGMIIGGAIGVGQDDWFTPLIGSMIFSGVCLILGRYVGVCSTFGRDSRYRLIYKLRTKILNARDHPNNHCELVSSTDKGTHPQGKNMTPEISINIGDNATIINSSFSATSSTPTDKPISVADTPKPSINQELGELERAIKHDLLLTETGKKEALTQIAAIREAISHPQGEVNQATVRTALDSLKEIVTSVNSTAQLLEVSQKVWPFIANFFGI